jgi:hypothetical protein
MDQEKFAKLPLFVQKEILAEKQKQLLIQQQEEIIKRDKEYYKNLTQEEIQFPYGKPPTDRTSKIAWNE